MTGDRQLAEAAQVAARSRLRHYADAPSSEVRSGRGWLAVRTGAASNDMNGVVSDEDAVLTPATVLPVVAWFAETRTPASWWVRRADDAVTDALVAAGAHPERSGRWSGGPLPTVVAHPSPDVTVRRVDRDDELDVWLGLATTCGWVDGPRDREARRRLYQGLGLTGSPLRHWLARVDDEPVGFASSHVVDEVVDLCNLAVLGPWRRRGVGRALVAARLADAAGSGGRTVVSAPSHDGWQLQRSLGLRNVPVLPDTCFYLPGP